MFPFLLALLFILKIRLGVQSNIFKVFDIQFILKNVVTQKFFNRAALMQLTVVVYYMEQTNSYIYSCL